MMTPQNHIPWLQAHSHVSGTSHHRGRRSLALASHAVVKTTLRMKVTIWGRNERLALMPPTPKAVMTTATSGSATRRAHR